MGESKLAVVAGTRPELIKIWPVVSNLEKLGIDFEFVWTSQHKDYEMSRIFFEELDLPEPSVYLDLPSSEVDVARRTAYIMSGLSKALERLGVRIVYALGDTSSVVAAALTAKLKQLYFVHDEAGMRSFDPRMPEEHNRIVADSIADLHLAPTILAALNLLAEGHTTCSIHVVGSTAVDAVKSIRPLAKKKCDEILARLKIDEVYAVATVHRRENITSFENLIKVVNLLKGVASILSEHKGKLLIPLHPHTRMKLASYGLLEKLANAKNIILIKPLGYIEFISLLTRARFVITDSGGIQVEAFVLGVPAITIRNATEWPETILAGANRLVGLDPKRAIHAAAEILTSAHKPRYDGSLGNGKAGQRIAKILAEVIESGIETCLPTRVPDKPILLPVLRDGDDSALRGLCFDDNGLPSITPTSRCIYRFTYVRHGVSRLLRGGFRDDRSST